MQIESEAFQADLPGGGYTECGTHSLYTPALVLTSNNGQGK